eukprot:4677314-Prorocentrum_lima.AAC.1
MTSSLVGSEMCIRDRNKSQAPGRAEPQAFVARRAEPQTANHDYVLSCVCLLYTSDAADDM